MYYYRSETKGPNFAYLDGLLFATKQRDRFNFVHTVPFVFKCTFDMQYGADRENKLLFTDF